MKMWFCHDMRQAETSAMKMQAMQKPSNFVKTWKLKASLRTKREL